MKKIPSFQIDHTILEKGIYISRIDDDITTYDIRMRAPNREPVMTNASMHTIEHLFATYVRNTEFGDNIIYFGPMGFWGSIPGAAMSECGNWRDHNLLQAKEDAKQFLEIIQDWTKDDLKYPTKDEN